MSIAAPFLYHRPFPLCPGVLNKSAFEAAGYQVWSGLTLAEMMHIFWNLESVELSVSASVEGTYDSDLYATTLAGTIALSPTARSATGNFSALNNLSAYAGGFFGAPSSASAIGDLTVKQPYQRVCLSYSAPYVMGFYAEYNAAGDFISSDITIYFGIDNADSAKWSLALSFSAVRQQVLDPVAGGIQVLSRPTGLPLTSNGTFNFLGRTWDYYSGGSAAETTTDFSSSFSMTSGFFSYA